MNQASDTVLVCVVNGNKLLQYNSGVRLSVLVYVPYLGTERGIFSLIHLLSDEFDDEPRWNWFTSDRQVGRARHRAEVVRCRYCVLAAGRLTQFEPFIIACRDIAKNFAIHRYAACEEQKPPANILGIGAAKKP